MGTLRGTSQSTVASSWHGVGLLLAYVFLFAICDAIAPTNWAIVGEYFGRQTFSWLRGYIQFANFPGVLFAPVFVGWWYDHHHSYALPIMDLCLGAAGGGIDLRCPQTTSQQCPGAGACRLQPRGAVAKNARTHVLEFALRGLRTAQRDVLHTIAAFRMPATWETLHTLLVGEEQKPCQDDGVLDVTLTELEDRGLVGWDKTANRYDLHPIVRGVVWQALDVRAQQDIYHALHRYFDAAPRPPAWENVESLEDLRPGIELFHTLIGLDRYVDAFVVFEDYLDQATLYRLSANRQREEWLERLFPDGVERYPGWQVRRRQSYTLNALAAAYQHSGEPGRAEPLLRRAVEIGEREKDGGECGRRLMQPLRGTAVLWSSP